MISCRFASVLGPAAMVAFAACGTLDVSDPAALESQEQPIIGGTYDTGDPEVFEMFIQGNNMMGAGCTATLIDRRTLLTAAHCVDPRTIGATSIQISVHNKANDNVVNFSDLIRVVEMRFHPQWSGQGVNDIGLALLASAPAVTPKSWNRESLNALTGQPLRAVGYGASMGGPTPTGGGVKRQVPLTFRQMFSDVYFLGDGTAHGICHGDSGGPSFHTFPDGVERVVGVHSFTTTEACLTGADARTDYYASFINLWLSQKEGPSCDEDGRCAQGCTTPDIDCVCAADNLCNPGCPNLQKDPDCPPDCGPNGACSLQACPTVDSDCVDYGKLCTTAQQCPGRLCQRDDQHTDAYCTRTCAGNSDCWDGAECDVALGRCRYTYVAETPVGDICTPYTTFCALGTRCAGPTPDYTYCSFRCVSQSDCPAGSGCTTSFDGAQYCQAPQRPQIVLSGMTVAEGPAEPTCSVAGGLAPVLALLLLRRRRRS